MNRLWIWTVLISYVMCEVLGDEARKGCPMPKAILPCRCLLRGDEYQIWCTHSDLPSVLDGLRATAKYIQDPIDEVILENNYLPSLPGKTFFPLKILRLMLRHNGLERVSNDWLGGLETTLVELFMVEPRLRSIPEDSLMPMISLEAITIETELMKRLPLFSGLPKIRYLQIKSTSLMELSPRNFKDNPSLEKLHIGPSPRLNRLEANLLRDLPSLRLVNISYSGVTLVHPIAITRLPVLDELVLIGNRISDARMVGLACRELPQLQVLRLDQNYLDILEDGAFVDLPVLRSLHLSNNRIRELHQGAFDKVPRLRNLNLNGNILRRIHPGSFLPDSGNRLEELLLVDNKISHVADLRVLLDALPHLVFLDMSYNNLEAIPFGSLRGHQTLEHLNLDYNNIHLIDREAFVAMPALRELRLKNNSLSNSLVPPLWNLPQLKGLDLSGNMFRRLEHNFLSDLPSLRKLDISRNELLFIDPAAFSANPTLEYINISNNALSNVHPSTFKHLINLYELDASNNALTEFIPGLPHGIEYLHLQNNRIVLLPINPDLPALKILDLTRNRIEIIPQGAFLRLIQLRRLYMGQNFLKRLENGSLRGLTKLEALDLMGNSVIYLGMNVFKDTNDLRDLNMGNNRLELLNPEIFQHLMHLKILNLTQNSLTEILPGTMDKNNEIQMIDISHNKLVRLPTAFMGLKNIRVLNMNHNRLNAIDPEILGSLPSLKTLKIAHNFIRELKEHVFHKLQHLASFDLEDNQLENIEPGSVKNLPVLKQIRLSRNKIKDIPKMTFVNLPSLQIVELQENQLRSIAPNAFMGVPHLLMLNLSHNEISHIEDAGLKGVKSLEMLDLSYNDVKAVVSPNLEKMEWLVELRLDSNKICGVHGSPFNNMPRLRVLSMRNNQLVSFPERSIERIRSNIAILDIDGNPLACTCNMLWLQAWLHESGFMGPKCADGAVLLELDIPREECSEEERNIELVAPGCESELLSAPGLYGTSQLSTQWLNLKNGNGSIAKNNYPPTPEESEYFYDEYVDYPDNGTSANLIELTTKKNSVPSNLLHTTKSKSVLNDKEIPKEVSNSPSSSGFTFFGLPLPNLDPLFRPNSRNDNILPIPPIKINERIGIVNKPEDIMTNIARLRKIPNIPQLESGGFVPILPGTGGFKPMPSPFSKQQVINLTPNNSPKNQFNSNKVTVSTTSTEKIIDKKIHKELTSNFISSTPRPLDWNTTRSTNKPDYSLTTDTTATTTLSKFKENTEMPNQNKKNVKGLTTEHVQDTTLNPIEETTILKIESTTILELPTRKSSIKDLFDKGTIQSSSDLEKQIATSIPQAAFLIPGGQQPAKKKATITKVHSPITASLNEPLISTQENSNLSVELTTLNDGIPRNDLSWYFATYNNTNQEVFKGTGSSFKGKMRLIILNITILLFKYKYFIL